jgi:hypothetical protein
MLPGSTDVYGFAGNGSRLIAGGGMGTAMALLYTDALPE